MNDDKADDNTDAKTPLETELFDAQNASAREMDDQTDTNTPSKKPRTGLESVGRNDRTPAAVDEYQNGKKPLSDIFMDLAVSMSSRTADLGTGVGCVLVNAQCQILGIGYNAEAKATSAHAANHNSEELMVHAEMNAIAHSIVNLMKEDIYVFVTRQPCEQCMKALAQYNIKCIFFLAYAGYNSVTVANNKKIPMVQYDAVFKYKGDASLKDEEYAQRRHQKIVLRQEFGSDHVEYVTNSRPNDLTSSMAGAGGRHGGRCPNPSPVICVAHKSKLTCSECMKEIRKARLPDVLHISTTMYEGWCEVFKVKQMYRKLENNV
jgi:deoxycytidylate deaminase